MRRVITWAICLSAPTVLAGCGMVDSHVQATLAKVEPYVDSGKTLPGLEPLANRPQPDRAPDLPMEPPKPILPAQSPFPQTLASDAEARALTEGDPMARRMLLLRRLTDMGLTPPEPTQLRLAANMGALAPASTPLPPAAGMDLPLPPPEEIISAVSALWPERMTPQGAGPMNYILDSLAPTAPKRREKVLIPDKITARSAMERADRLRQAGLIDRRTRDAEKAALETMLADPNLPENASPPPEPPKPEPKKKTAGAGAGSAGGAVVLARPGASPTQRMPGGVSGKLQIISSPEEIHVPPIPPGYAGQAGMHLLSMASENQGEKAWATLTKDHPALAALTYKVVRADLGDLGVTHRLIAGPLSPAEAAKICIDLAGTGQLCRPTPFPP